jgi:hypothetical protein
MHICFVICIKISTATQKKKLHNTSSSNRVYEEFEDTKGVIRIRKSRKNIKHNEQMKKDKRTNNDLKNINIKLKIRDLIPIQTLKKLLIFIEDQNEYIIFNIFKYKNSAPEFTLGFKWGSCYSIFSFIFMFFRSLFVLLSFFICSLCFMFFLDLRILITPLVSKIIYSFWSSIKINNFFNVCIGIRSLISCDLFCPQSPTDVPFLTSSPLNTCFLDNVIILSMFMSSFIFCDSE